MKASIRTTHISETAIAINLQFSFLNFQSLIVQLFETLKQVVID